MSKVAESPRVIILAEADPTVHRIFPDLAAEIGLDESIFLMQVSFWLKTGGKYIDNQWWTWQSIREMHEKAFKYWSISTINRIAKKLIDAGYLFEANYNDKKYDRTRWFALNVEMLRTLNSITIMIGDKKLVHNETRLNHSETQSAQDETRQNQSETTIPESLTESLSEIKEKDSSSMPEEAAPSDVAGELLQDEPIAETPVVEEIEALIIQAEELPIVIENVQAVVEESASQLEAPEGSEISPVSEIDAETIAQLALASKIIDEIMGEAEQLDPDPIAPEELEVVEGSDAVRLAEEHVQTVTKKLSPYKEAVRRVLSPVDELAAADSSYVALWVGFFCGTLKSTKMKKHKELQLSDNPMSAAQIAGMLLWFRSSPKHNWKKTMPDSPDGMRSCCDEFLALPSHDAWVEKGQQRLDQIMSGNDSKPDSNKPESRVANAQKPPSEADMTEVDWEAEERKYQESIRGQQKSNVPA
jgi:hypothetical protein